MATDGRMGAMAVGPRLLGKLTAELILRSPQFMSCLKLYEIDLRGQKIATIENLGATENQFDSIDLSDNVIVRLEGFPRLSRLSQLFLNNNRIGKINKACHEAIPNLETLILTNNRIANLQDLDALGTWKKLSLLSLVGNPVAMKPNYRLYVISKCKALKTLDFKKVKQKERDEAAKLFPSEEAASKHSAQTFSVDADYEAQTQGLDAAPAADAAAPESNGHGPAAPTPTAAPAGPTAAQMVAIRAAIANASTMEEIRRLEDALTTGHLPSTLVIPAPSNAQASAAAEPASSQAAQAAGSAEQDVAMADAPAAQAEGGAQADAGGPPAADAPQDMAVG